MTEIAEWPMGPRTRSRSSASASACTTSRRAIGGEQRVAIARAIAKRPQLLLCDEPTGALDSATGVLVLEAIESVNRELGTATALITHNAPIARDRVIRFGDGHIVETRVNAQRQPARELHGERDERQGAGRPAALVLHPARARAEAPARPPAPARAGLCDCSRSRRASPSSRLSPRHHRGAAPTPSAFYDRSNFADVFAS